MGVLAAVVVVVTAGALTMPASTMTADVQNNENNAGIEARADGDQAKTIVTSEMLDYQANAWQIVSDDYASEEENQNTSLDGNVRVKKSVIPTNTENEFLVHLSIDEKLVYDDYFKSNMFARTNKDNSERGSIVDDPHANDVGISFDGPIFDNSDSAWMTIVDINGQVLVDDVQFWWDHSNNYSFYLPVTKDNVTQYILLASGITPGTHTTITLTENAGELIESNVSPITTLTEVADTMGSHIEYLGVQASGNNDEVTPSSGSITWKPALKNENDYTVVDKVIDSGEGSEQTGGHRRSEAWALNIAELVYKVRLRVEDNGFNSCANNMDSDVTDPESTAVNSEAKLTYGASGSTVAFPVPYVRGLRYDINFDKVDAEETSIKLSGATFTLTKKDGPGQGTTYQVTDNAGTYSAVNLPWGTYTLEETNPPEGYELGETTSWEITVCKTSDPDGVMQVDNNPNMVYKHNSDGPTWQITNGKSKKTTLTLSKTFNGLSDAEVSYLLFKNNGFGWDVNYCVKDPYNSGSGNTFMAPKDDLEGFKIPGTDSDATNGGDFRIVANDCLNTNKLPDNGTYTYTHEASGMTATLSQQNGNWTFSITFTVPKCDDNHFYTVYEQHAEVPGYAKLNDSNATYTIKGIEGADDTYSGKFVDYGCDKGIYEDMGSEVEIDKSAGYDKENAREESAIAANQLTHLKITGPTSIAFTNNYTGKLDVKKEIGQGNQLGHTDSRDFYITLTPAHKDKVTVVGGLSCKTVHYIVDSGAEQTAALGNDGSFTITLKPGQTAHFTDLPAIQWQVVEDSNNNAVEDYNLTVTYADENNDVVSERKHWNGYAESDIIGATDQNDGVASVDSAIRDDPAHQVDASAKALVTVTNVYKLKSVDVKVKKTDQIGNALTGAVFRLYRLSDGDEKEYYPKEGEAWATSANGAMEFTSAGKDASFVINALDPSGTYYLEEVTAPGGYRLLEHAVQISWTVNGDLQAYYQTGTEAPQELVENGAIVIQNTAGEMLPETGGSGNTPLIVGGLTLIAVAACGYGLRRRHEGRGARS